MQVIGTNSSPKTIVGHLHIGQTFKTDSNPVYMVTDKGYLNLLTGRTASLAYNRDVELVTVVVK